MYREIPLEPGEYTGTYKAVGGALALDFANLVSYRDGPRPHDWLDPPANLAVWAAEIGGHPDDRWQFSPGLVSEVIGEAIVLRELLGRIFTARADRHEPAESDLATLADTAHTARCHQQLDVHYDPPTWKLPDDHPPGRRLLDTIALDAARVFTDENLTRLRTCPGCRWVFLDTSPTGRRQWCDPADCGNRARQRRHYHRSKPRSAAERYVADNNRHG